MDISATNTAKHYQTCNLCHASTFNSAQVCEQCGNQVAEEEPLQLSHEASQNSLYTLATISSVVAGIVYILNYYSMW